MGFVTYIVIVYPLILLLNVCSGSFSSMAVPSSTTDAILIVVDQSGQGDYTTIQKAIDAVSSNNSELIYISIKPGTYRCILTSFRTVILHFRLDLHFIRLNLWFDQRENRCSCG